MIYYNYRMFRRFILFFFAFSMILSRESQAGQLRYNTQEASYQGEGVSAHCYANGTCTSSYSGPRGNDGGYNTQSGQQTVQQATQVMQTGAQMVDTIGDIQQISHDREQQREDFEQEQKQFDEQEQLLDQEYAQEVQTDQEADHQAKIEQKSQEEGQKQEEAMNLIKGGDFVQPWHTKINPTYEDPGNHTTSDQVTDKLPPFIGEEALQKISSANPSPQNAPAEPPGPQAAPGAANVNVAINVQGRIEVNNQSQPQRPVEGNLIRGERKTSDSLEPWHTKTNPTYEDPGNHTTSDQVTDKLPPFIGEEALQKLSPNTNVQAKPQEAPAPQAGPAKQTNVGIRWVVVALRKFIKGA